MLTPFPLGFLLLLLLSTSVSVSRLDPLPIVVSGCQYLSDVLLAPSGPGLRSRCDYHWIEGHWLLYEPAWHTGQTILALLEAYETFPHSPSRDSWLKTATEAGKWWKSLSITSPPSAAGMIDGRALGETWPLPLYVVVSTVTDGTHGLVRLADITQDSALQTALLSAADWMIENMYIPSHSLFYDCMDPSNGKVQTVWSPFFPNTTSPTLFQLARPNNEGFFWLDCYRMSHNEKYLDVFLAISDGLVSYQDSDGIWMQFSPNDASTGFVHPRFNLWYAESLLEAFNVTQNTTYLTSALKTLRTYRRFLHTGTDDSELLFYYKNYITGETVSSRRDSVCGSALAFLGLLWMRVAEMKVTEEFNHLIPLVAKWLEKNRFSESHNDPNLKGAFFETRGEESDLEYEYDVYVRGLATSFGIRFLSKYYHYQSFY